jgi:ribokinase
LWGHAVGINSVIGHDYPEENLAALEAHGIFTEGIRRIPDWSLRLWLLHEENNKKQQFPKLQSSTFQHLDANRPEPPKSYWSARGYHLAPATPEGQKRSREVIRRKRLDAILSLDILTEPFITWDAYRNGSAFQGIDVFSPSIVEIEALWPGENLEDVIRRLTGFGLRQIAIKMDTRGALVHDAKIGTSYHVPIYPVKTVDTTGAGDAFSGGFLEGIVETGDVVEAGLRATISASFAVEHWGALGMLSVTRDDAEHRLAFLKAQLGLASH